MSKARELAELGAVYDSGALSNRNMIINGDMRIDQRNGGSAITINNTSNVYSVDRFFGTGQVSDGVFTLQRSSTAPEGLVYSLVATVTTADASVGATQQYLISQSIEGYNSAQLQWGAADARTATLSFWVRSSVTGTFGGAVMNHAFDRSYPFSYTVLSANTWEKKSITISGDTTGSWGSTTGTGIRVYFNLGAGATYCGTAGSWSGSFLIGVTGQDQLISTNGATFYLTGVQFEAGPEATPFEHRSYGEELARCQRYFHQTAYYGQTLGGGITHTEVFYHSYLKGVSTWEHLTTTFPVTMRIPPTITTTDANGNTGKFTYFTSSGGAYSVNNTPYTTYQTIDGFKCSDYNGSNYGFSYDYRADAEL